MAASLALQRRREILQFTQQVSRVVVSYRTHATAAATASARPIPTSNSVPAVGLSSADKVLDPEVLSFLQREQGLNERHRTAPAAATPQALHKVTATTPPSLQRHPVPQAGSSDPAATLAPLLSTLRAAHLSAPSSSPASLISSLRSHHTFFTKYSQLEADFPPPPPPNDRRWKEKLMNTLLVQAILLGAGGLGLLRNGKRGKGILGEFEGEFDKGDELASEGEKKLVRAKVTRSCLDDGEGVMSLNLLIASYVWRPTLPWTLPSEDTGTKTVESSPTPSQILSLVKLFNKTTATSLPTSSTLSLNSPLIPDRFTLLTLLSYLYLSETPPTLRFPVLLWIWREFSRLSLSSSSTSLKSPEVIAIDRVILNAILDLLLDAAKRLKKLEKAATSIAFELVDGVAEVVLGRGTKANEFWSGAGEGASPDPESLLQDLVQVATILGHFPVLDQLLDVPTTPSRSIRNLSATSSRFTLPSQLRLDASLGQLFSLWTHRSLDSENPDPNLPPVWAVRISKSSTDERTATGYRDRDEDLVNARIVVHRIVRGVVANLKDCLKNRVMPDWKRIHQGEKFVLEMLRHKSWGVDVPLEELVTELVCLTLNHHGTSFSTRRSSDDEHDFFTDLLAFLVQSRQPRLASDIFDALPPQIRLQADYDALIAAHHLPTSKSAWDSLIRCSPFRITRHSLRQRLRSHANSQNNDLVGAYDTLDEAASHGVEAGLLEYNLVLKIAVEVGTDLELRRCRKKMKAHLEEQGEKTSDARTSNILLMREMATPRPFIKGQRVSIAGRGARVEGQVKRMKESIGKQLDRREKALATSTSTLTASAKSISLPPLPDKVTISLLLKGLSHSPSLTSTRDLSHLAGQLLQIDLVDSDPVSTYRSTKKEYETHRRAKYLMLIKALWHRDAFELRSKLLRGMREEERRIRLDAGYKGGCLAWAERGDNESEET